FTTEQFSGIKGTLVTLKDSVDGCERILNDEFKDYPENALYMIGTIGEAKKNATDQPAEPANMPETTQKTGVTSETEAAHE
ncbi:MAG: F0F1 ATP synthase subunit beta, partial [bacterium]